MSRRQRSSQTQRLSQSQWPPKSQQLRRSQAPGRLSLSQAPERPANLQMLWGALLPYKKRKVGEGEDSEESDGPEEVEEPQFLDAEEMCGGGVVLKSSYCRRCKVTIADKICKQDFDVTGRFPLQGPWWEVRVNAKCVGTMYYMKGFPSYFLRSDFGGNERPLLSLFLAECHVPNDSVQAFLSWLPPRPPLTFHNLKKVLNQFSTSLASKNGGCDILPYVENSCPGLNSQNALLFPLIMEYLPSLMPRLFKNLLKWERKRRVGDDEETEKAEKEALYSNVDVLTKIEVMLEENPWKLGFSPITYRELGLVRCEVTLNAFQQWERLLQKIPELQMNALHIYNQLKQRCREYGDTYVEQETLTKAASQSMSIVQAWDALEFLKQEEIVVRESDRIFLQNLYRYENDIANCIEELINRDPWRINIDVEQVLRAQQVKLVQDVVTDDTLEDICSQLPEMYPQEPNIGDPDAHNKGDFMNTGQETREEGPAELEVDPDQVRAAQMICSNPLTIISGKGGCGKTTVVSLIFKHLLSKENEEVEKACKAFESDFNASEEWSTQSRSPRQEDTSENMKVLLTAPTGKAASLLKKKTNLSSFTLHQITASYYHWLKSDKNKKWKFSAAEALVVDEGSLVSVQILSSVLKLLCQHAKLSKLVILGDVRQLPSIDPGNMLADVFQSAKNVHWAIELRTNHRAESQLIIDNATRISEQKFVEFDAFVDIGSGSDITMPSPDKKFILVSLPALGRDDDLQSAVRILLEKGPGLEDDKASQFIAFRRVDCDLINELCCMHYSQHHTIDRKNKPVFQCQDKVCCSKNAHVKDLIPDEKPHMALKDKTPSQDQGDAPTLKDGKDPENGDTKEGKGPRNNDSKEERLCNGEIFFIIDDVERDDGVRCLTLSDMGERIYELDYLKLHRDCDIKHAWARTIHTFQGSEEGTIVYVVGTAGRQDWQHVYTAVTRGRQRVYIIAKEDQLNKAVSNKCRPRKTRLQQRLKEKLAQINETAPTSSPPSQLSQEGRVPSSPIVASQDMDVTHLPFAETCDKKCSIPTGLDASCNQNALVRTSDPTINDEIGVSDFEAVCQSPGQLGNFSPGPLIFRDTLLERHDLQTPILGPLRQQEHECYDASTHAFAGGGHASVHAFGDRDQCRSGGVPDANTEDSIADSFGSLNDSEIETLFGAPLDEEPSVAVVASADHKRSTNGEDVAESPLKIRRVMLDDSPLGCTRFNHLSLTSTSKKKLSFNPL